MQTPPESKKTLDVAALIAGAIGLVALVVWIVAWWSPMPQEEVARVEPPDRPPPQTAPPAAPVGKAAAPTAVEPAVEPPASEAKRAAPVPEPKPQPAPRVAAAPAKPAPVEPREAPAPPAKRETPKSEPAATVDPALQAMRGNYVGNLYSGSGGNSETIGFSLVISSVENGSVTGTATLGGRGCNGAYPMKGTFENRKLRLRSTRNGGPAGDCPLNVVLGLEGDRLVGATDTGDTIQLRR